MYNKVLETYMHTQTAANEGKMSTPNNMNFSICRAQQLLKNLGLSESLHMCTYQTSLKSCGYNNTHLIQ